MSHYFKDTAVRNVRNYAIPLSLAAKQRARQMFPLFHCYAEH